MVIFRENTEDVYAGFETKMDEVKTAELIAALESLFGWKVKADSGIGIKPISRSGTERLVKAAIDYAVAHNRKSVTLVHKGNIMKFTEGAFRDIGYETAGKFYGARPLDGGPWRVMKNPKTGADIVIKDVIADAFLQQILTRPAEYDVIATMNLNGDYISDALAAQVGGIGIAPGANINYITGTAVFEATHGTAPKYAGQDKVNPCSLILSGKMMFDYLGWTEAGALIDKGIESAIAGYDGRCGNGFYIGICFLHHQGNGMRRLLQAFFLTAAVLTVAAQTARTPQNGNPQAETAADAVKAEKTAVAAEGAAENGADTAVVGGTAVDSRGGFDGKRFRRAAASVAWQRSADGVRGIRRAGFAQYFARKRSVVG